MKLAVVVDNHPFNGFKNPWGLSIYGEYSNVKFLWDTGPDTGALEFNSKKLGIDLSDINFLAFSHEHFDHTGGLTYILKIARNKNFVIYYPSGGSSTIPQLVKKLGRKIILVTRTIQVAQSIFVTAPLYGPPWEEALAIVVKEGIILLAGCSHPGISRLAEKAVNNLKRNLYAVIGGFHLGSAPHSRVEREMLSLIGLGAKKISPIHCSGEYTRSFLKKNYPEIYLPLHVGSVIKL